MIKKLTKIEIQEAYTDVLRYGVEGVKSLEIKQIDQIREYAEKKQLANFEICAGLVESNSDKPENYPLEYRGERELEYWESKIKGYNEPKLVLSKINDFLNEAEHETKDNLQPQPQEAETTSFKFENKFDDVSEADVYNHFKKLVDKKMLSDLELNEYLIKAFQETTLSKKTFKLKRNFSTKSDVRKIFYDYYKDIAQKPHGKKDDYVKLLTDYFEGYNFETTKTNFSK